jgi:hypothetical protein
VDRRSLFAIMTNSTSPGRMRLRRIGDTRDDQ